MPKTKIQSKKRGQPAKAAEDRHSKSICCWLTEESKERITRAAQAAGDAAGHWLGKVGDEAARRALAALGLS